MRVVVRRALAGEVGQEQEAGGAGEGGLGLGQQAGRCRARRAARRRRRGTLAPFSIAAIWYQRPGSAVAEGVDQALRGRAVGSRRRRRTAPRCRARRSRRPRRRRRCRSPPAGASPAPPATITPAGRPKRRARSGRTAPAGAVPSTRRGSMRRSRPLGASDRVATSRAAPRRASSVPAASDDVGGALAGELQADKSLGRRSEAARAQRPGSWRGQPEQLRRREAGHRRARRAMRASSGTPRAWSSAALGLGAAVVPQDGRPQRPVGRVEQHRAVHLAREADRGHAGHLARCARRASRSRALATACHQSSGSCSEASGAGWRGRERHARLAEDGLGLVDEDDLDRRGAEVDAEEARHRPRSAPARRRPRGRRRPAAPP